jgi:DNA-binding PadR family transcriptional regulator
MDPASQVPLNPRDYLILFSLVAEERHGYGIVKRVEADSSGQVTLDPANLYRAMKRLIRDGLVATGDERASDESGGQKRRYYTITAFGREVVALEAARLAALADAARAAHLIPSSESRR